MKDIITEEKLSQNLKVARISKGFTQEQVADMLGVSRATFNTYENNPYNLAFGLFNRLATIYDLNVKSFFTE